eukprot:2537036-Pleurochrysis_carterae.AAC.1
MSRLLLAHPGVQLDQMNVTAVTAVAAAPPAPRRWTRLLRCGRRSSPRTRGRHGAKILREK